MKGANLPTFPAVPSQPLRRTMPSRIYPTVPTLPTRLRRAKPHLSTSQASSTHVARQTHPPDDPGLPLPPRTTCLASPLRPVRRSHPCRPVPTFLPASISLLPTLLTRPVPPTYRPTTCRSDIPSFANPIDTLGHASPPDNPCRLQPSHTKRQAWPSHDIPSDLPSPLIPRDKPIPLAPTFHSPSCLPRPSDRPAPAFPSDLPLFVVPDRLTFHASLNQPRVHNEPSF